jgi:hypothetical protein
MSDRTELYRVTADFVQEGNTLSTTEETEVLHVELEYPVGEVLGPFIVIRTSTGWSIDEPEELQTLLKRVKRAAADMIVEEGNSDG